MRSASEPHTDAVPFQHLIVPHVSTVGSAGALADFVAGALGGIALCGVTQPFDTVKVIMQSQPGRFTSSLACAKSIVQQSPLALFRGMGMPMATIPLVNAIVFWAYGDAKRFLTPPRAREDLALWQLSLAGAYGGLVNSLVVGPVELVKVQLQSQAADAAVRSCAGAAAVAAAGTGAGTGAGVGVGAVALGVAHMHTHAMPPLFKGPLDFVRHACGCRGWRAPLQGLVPTIIRELPAYAGQFFVYEGYLRWMSERRARAHFSTHSRAHAAAGTPMPPAPTITTADQLLAGGLSGVAAWGVSYPLDVIKTRVQSLPVGLPRPAWAARHWLLPDDGFLSVGRHILRHEGMAGFWRGFGPCIIPAFPANALGFVVYELCIAGWVRVGWE